MTEHEIRLECLKLCHRHDREPAQVVKNAEQYEAYVKGPAPQVPQVSEPEPVKETETPRQKLTLPKADNPKRAG